MNISRSYINKLVTQGTTDTNVEQDDVSELRQMELVILDFLSNILNTLVSE